MRLLREKKGKSTKGLSWSVRHKEECHCGRGAYIFYFLLFFFLKFAAVPQFPEHFFFFYAFPSKKGLRPALAKITPLLVNM